MVSAPARSPASIEVMVSIARVRIGVVGEHIKHLDLVAGERRVAVDVAERHVSRGEVADRGAVGGEIAVAVVVPDQVRLAVDIIGDESIEVAVAVEIGELDVETGAVAEGNAVVVAQREIALAVVEPHLVRGAVVIRVAAGCAGIGDEGVHGAVAVEIAERDGAALAVAKASRHLGEGRVEQVAVVEPDRIPGILVGDEDVEVAVIVEIGHGHVAAVLAVRRLPKVDYVERWRTRRRPD